MLLGEADEAHKISIGIAITSDGTPKLIPRSRFVYYGNAFCCQLAVHFVDIVNHEAEVDSGRGLLAVVDLDESEPQLSAFAPDDLDVARTDPGGRHGSIGLPYDLEPKHIAVEPDRSFQIGDDQAHREQPFRFHLGAPILRRLIAALHTGRSNRATQARPSRRP
jgi:hypothetical protein